MELGETKQFKRIEDLNLKEFKFIDFESHNLKNKNWLNYEYYLKQNHPFYIEFLNKSLDSINKEVNCFKSNVLKISDITLKDVFRISLISTSNYGRKWEDSLINACLNTKTKKDAIKYLNLIFKKDKEDLF